MATGSLVRRSLHSSSIAFASSLSFAVSPRPFSTDAASTQDPVADEKPPYEMVAELTNPPKFLLKEELLSFFRGCNLSADRAYTVLDDKLRQKNWRLEFLTKEDFERAQRILAANPRIGSRFVKLRLLSPYEARPLDDTVNTIIARFRDRSLVMIGAPDELRVESIERFFHGYHMAPRGIWHFWVEMGQPGVPYSKAQTRQRDYSIDSVVNNGIGRERRTVVMFRDRNEVLRAMRERQGGFLQEKSVELRLIQ